jgi:ribosomal protein S18 acetylase RimI-like enzyme
MLQSRTSSTLHLDIAGALEHDIAGIMQLLSHAVSAMASQGIHQWNSSYPDQAVITGDIAAGSLYVAGVSSQIAGIIVLNEWQPKEYEAVAWQYTEPPVLVVHRLCVDPAFQGRGVATQLMDFAERHAAVSGYHTLRFDTFSQNRPALNLYQRLGYRQAGTVQFIPRGDFRCFEKPISPPSV